MVPWTRNAKIAFIGSHGIRKTTAALAFASVIQRAGRAVEFAREVVRDNPLGINEGATAEAQLWVLTSQIRRELELSRKAECLVTDCPLCQSNLDTRQDALFQEGMTFSFHPRRNLLPEVRTTGINENILITADGIERLSEPWDLRWQVIP